MKYSWRNLLWDKLVPWMVWLSTIGVAIYENGVAIYEWCGYLRMVWLSTKKVWLFQLAFLGLLVGAKKSLNINFYIVWHSYYIPTISDIFFPTEHLICTENKHSNWIYEVLVSSSDNCSWRWNYLSHTQTHHITVVHWHVQYITNKNAFCLANSV